MVTTAGRTLAAFHQLAIGVIHCPHEKAAGAPRHCLDCGAVEIEGKWCPSTAAQEIQRIISTMRRAEEGGPFRLRPREFPIGFTARSVGPREVMRIRRRPQLVFRPERLSVARSCAEFFEIVDVSRVPYNPERRGETDEEETARLRRELSEAARAIPLTSYADRLRGTEAPFSSLLGSSALVESNPLPAECFEQGAIDVRTVVDTLEPGDALDLLVHNTHESLPQSFRATYYGTVID